MYSEEELRRLDALRTVRTHSGADFESGEVYQRGGLNKEAPGVDAVVYLTAESRSRVSGATATTTTATSTTPTRVAAGGDMASLECRVTG